MKLGFGRSLGSTLSLLGFLVISATWATRQMISTSIGCDGERYFLAGHAMRLGLDPYVRLGAQTYVPYPPFLAWVLHLLGLAQHPWMWQLVVVSSAVVLVYATLVLAGLGASKLAWLATVLLAGQSFAGDIGTSNAQVPVAALLALALLAVDRERYAVASVLCGLTAALKVTPALLIAFMLVRALGNADRRPARFVLVSTAVAAATLLVPWTSRWFEVVMLGGGAGESNLSGGNLSWPGYMARLGVPLPALVPALFSLGATILLARKRPFVLLPSLGIVLALALAGAPLARGFTYLTLLPAIAVLLRELRLGHHFLGAARGRDLAEYGSVFVFTMVAVNTDFFYLHDAWIGRQVLPLVPMLGTLSLAWALWRTQAGARLGDRIESPGG
jgi:hypothetical protein